MGHCHVPGLEVCRSIRYSQMHYVLARRPRDAAEWLLSAKLPRRCVLPMHIHLVLTLCSCSFTMSTAYCAYASWTKRCSMDGSGNAKWKGLTWGMMPLLAGALCACTYHFFYNSSDLDFLVAVQASLTWIGNATCAAAAYRIYKSAQQEGAA